jgi:hypothetical protein
MTAGSPCAYRCAREPPAQRALEASARQHGEWRQSALLRRQARAGERKRSSRSQARGRRQGHHDSGCRLFWCRRVRVSRTHGPPNAHRPRISSLTWPCEGRRCSRPRTSTDAVWRLSNATRSTSPPSASRAGSLVIALATCVFSERGFGMRRSVARNRAPSRQICRRRAPPART